MAFFNRRNKSKVVPWRENSIFNIGTIMFGILFVYMLICLVLYLTATHITAYEVTAGPLSGNYRYSAVALKSESVVYTSQSGPIHYYAREGSKVGVGAGIYSIGSLNLAQEPSDLSEEELTSSDYAHLHSIASNFAYNYSPVSYQDVYNFQADAQTAMLELLSQRSLDNAQQGQGAALNLIPTQQDGIVVYSVDGMENDTPEDLTEKDFNRKNYTRTNLRMKESVNANDPVYKLITSENWSLIILLDRKTATELADQTVIRFRFMEDGSTFNADFSILQVDGNYYGKLDISNSLIRYAADRYVDIELLVNRQSGLKIPNSAIAEKVFYKIPLEFAIIDEENENEIGLLTETYDTDGSAITKYINATVYEKTENEFYVDTELFHEGDYVLMKDSSKRYQISEKKSLIGVYNINKGYPIFREITIIDENEEYCIVESNSAYGLAQYDHIALDASAVKEDAA
ncbi:MAG: HlyD family efflux transporter periplasmic adaptor subunit [Eubacteriales bacterium]|nr:HlyD family efflux transporter periplasmic adaptor subunit [Eubacteriales bacterium]